MNHGLSDDELGALDRAHERRQERINERLEAKQQRKPFIKDWQYWFGGRDLAAWLDREYARRQDDAIR